jgi:hypothetical protein
VKQRKDLSRLKLIEAFAHASGHEATRTFRTVLYGTRHFRAPSAGDAPNRRPADAPAIHSVYDGPRKVPGGAPVLKRNQPA